MAGTARRIPTITFFLVTFFPHILFVLMRLGCKVSIDEGKKIYLSLHFLFLPLFFFFFSAIFLVLG